MGRTKVSQRTPDPDPRIEAIRALLDGPMPSPLPGEPPPVDLGLTINVSNTGRLLELLDELERACPADDPAAQSEACEGLDEPRAFDPRIEEIRELLRGEGVPEPTWEPPGVPLGLRFDVSNPGRLLERCDEPEREHGDP